MDQAFVDACNFVMPFGKFAGQRIAQVGLSDEGLRYMDWLSRKDFLAAPQNGELRAALTLYLEYPALGSQVEATIEY